MEIFKRLDADVLCLNEVTQRLFVQLMNDQWIKDNYFIFMDDAICQNEEFFSNIMLCKHKPEVAFYLSWSHPELTYRPGIVLVIHVPASDIRLGIVGAHFKAFNSMSDARRTQFEESFALLDSLPVTYGCNELFLIGDLNIHQAFEESFIRSDAIDLWKHMNGESDKGYTFDGELNGTIQLTGGGTAWKSRYDRIIRMKKQDNILGLTSIQLFAQERLFSDENDPELPDKKALILTASDHFGLVLECTTDPSGQVWPEPPKEVLVHAPPPPAPPVFMPMSQSKQIIITVEQHVPMHQ